jgi:hypothetical protein
MGELMTQHPRRLSRAELTAGQIDADDMGTLAALAELYETLDPVPAGLVERIQFGVTLDGLNAEVAELQRRGDLVGIRSTDPSGGQTITFTSASLTTMVTIAEIATDRVRIDGWIAPGGGVSVELRTSGGSRHVIADANGRFVFDDVAHGLAQFILRAPEPGTRVPVITPSIEI